MTLLSAAARSTHPGSRWRLRRCAGASSAPAGSPTGSSPSLQPALQPAGGRGRLPYADSPRSAFADRHRIATAYGSYEQLVADASSTWSTSPRPHNAHLPVALLSLGAAKHTLVEKPLGATAQEARQIAAAAEAAGVFCLEAMWTAFLPKFDVLRQLQEAGALGEPLSVVADFGEWFAEDHRILRPELAGGPLLDLGTYLVAFALDALGPVDSVLAGGEWVPSGVLGQVGTVLGHPGDGVRSCTPRC